MSTKLHAVSIVVALAAGCGGPQLTNGGLTCSSDGKCPPGYHCASNNTCWENGREPGDDMGVGSDEDMALPGEEDMTPAPDLTPTLTNGQLCSDKSECISGFCADGICCDTACTDNCKSCNQPTALGKCTPLANGANPAHGTCGPDSTASCGRDGFCDANGNCRKYGSSTTCKTGSCSSTTNAATADSKCDGNGTCVTPSPILCDPYVCNGTTACFSSCTGTAQCKNAMPCNSMQCGPKLNGSPCSVGGECMSNNCVDGVCCDMPASSCSGCKQCNLASSLGTCTNVPSGQDPHGTCPTSAANCQAGGCNGSNACTPAANTVVCSSTCGATNQLTIKMCNGVSTGCTNAPTTSSCPSNLKCKDASSCAPNCSANGDADCLSGYYCSSGNCLPKVADGQGCSAANQCSSGVCGSYHRDADGDGYGVSGTTKFCGSSPPSGYVADATDCCDADNMAHPGQTGWFTSATGCGGYNFNCVNGDEHQYVGLGSCVTAGTCSVSVGLRCDYTAGWQGSEPGCGGSGNYFNGCNLASACTPCSDPGGCGRGCATAQIGSKQQGCH